MNKTKQIETMYALAKEQYADSGIDTDKVIEKMQNIAISLHCWQTDDGGGLEYEGAELSGGGIQATGNFPGKAGNIKEVRQDLEKVYSLLPGNHRLNLHAIYGDFDEGFVERDQIETKHYKSWV